jgi:hypothetical protein
MGVMKHAKRDKAELPCGYWQKCGNLHPYSLKHCFAVDIYVYKFEEAVASYKRKSSAAPLLTQTSPTTLLSASLNLVRQFP